MSIADGIKEARKKLEYAAQASDLLEKARLFEEGIEILDTCLDEEDISPSQRNLLSQLRFAHTRQLLSQLQFIQSVWLDESNIWYTYYGLFSRKLCDEVKRVITEDAELKVTFKNFIELRREELLKILFGT